MWVIYLDTKGRRGSTYPEEPQTKTISVTSVETTQEKAYLVGTHKLFASILSIQSALSLIKMMKYMIT
jgi:hypothetical protein